ncbi:hypothetical protein [Streptomyces sp. NPDC002588]|uniref:hypothetical protein n=1 Tax=Streptomyces sp. NPDC002588 TaxID=3154419 RepID=UPI00331DD55D
MTDTSQPSPTPETPATPDTPEAPAPEQPMAADSAAAEDSAPESPAPESPAAGRKRRGLWVGVRWGVAVAVFAAVGAAAAYGITGMKRTDVPGLATESDGRWAYPQITLPPLPSGKPGPSDSGNVADAHYADLRALVLPAPEGATDDKALRGTDGFLATKDFLSVYEGEEDREDAGQVLTDHALRHIAARGWTTEDGTRTRIYLLQFGTGTLANAVYGKFTGYAAPSYALRGAAETEFDDAYPTAADPLDITRSAYDEAKPYGAEQVRQAYVRVGDVIALVVQSRKGSAEAVPFQQTVALQSQLLG